MVAELHRIAVGAGQCVEQAFEPRQLVGPELRRELNDNRPQLVAQEADCVQESLQRFLYIHKQPLVGDLTGELGAKQESLRRSLPPAFHDLGRRDAVPGAVDLHRAEYRRVVAQIVLDAVGVEGCLPVIKGPAAGSCSQVHPARLPPCTPRRHA